MPGAFMFATGIENSCPMIEDQGRPLRRDEMVETCHTTHWRQDFEIVKQLGITHLRYGQPYYKVHIAPGKYDWGFTDETFRALREMGIIPIADLCHFGVPDWMGSFQNPDFPDLFAAYAGAFAKRYPWVRLYTPVNEIYIAALFSAQYGWWNEQLHSDRAFVTALKHLTRANVQGMHAILKETPEATFIQSESSEYFHAEEPSCQPQAYFLNQKRFLSLDLTYGRQVGSTMYEYLLDNGMTRGEFHWYLENHVKGNCVMGNDYYITNEHMVTSSGKVRPSGEIFGYYVITRQYYDRYRLPVMHTETNITADRAVPWLEKEWANVHRLQLDGVPIIGFTWYSLVDQIDWGVALRVKNDRDYTVGLCDLDRNIRPVGYAYKKLISTWKDILPLNSDRVRAYLL